MKKIIIDCDTGIDDAQSVMMALSAPDVQVLAITCVAGNCNLDTVALNNLRVLTVYDRLEVPVYKGAGQNLLERENVTAAFIHGDDGLGDAPHAYPQIDDSLIQQEHAVLALIRLVKQHKGEITLVCLGPLTNIALAIKMDPEFGSYLKEAVIMGGNIEGQGNNAMSLCGEYNFSVDSEAAYLVLKSLWCPIRLVSWEVCLKNMITWEKHDEVFNMDTPKGRFHKAITSMSVERKRARIGVEGFYTCDPVALLVAIDNSVILESCTKFCTVELKGEFTRGMVCVDWDWMNRSNKETNVQIVTKVDMDKFYQRFKGMVI